MAAEDRAPAPERTQLRDLLRERRAALGLSYLKLAQRCVDPESGQQSVKDSWLHRLETGQPVEPPKLAALRGMAVGLAVPLRVVQDAAAAEFFGVDTVYADDEEGRMFLSRFSAFSPEDRRKMLAVMDAWLKQ
ncbi:helix-turn-helix domain-containing protein [Streptomyces sp. NPDC017979]|uniref:helix-turn-helix domain-containing protein n=1 Tax=Streptomyces sp. NPDC017979 TaxID=3365024 RepID=UPI0037B840C2